MHGSNDKITVKTESNVFREANYRILKRIDRDVGLLVQNKMHALVLEQVNRIKFTVIGGVEFKFLETNE